MYEVLVKISTRFPPKKPISIFRFTHDCTESSANKKPLFSKGRKEVSVRCLSRASPGQFVLAKGSDIQCDEMVIKAGTTIGHLEVALLASLGISTIRVHKFPVVAVISYGAKVC